MVERQMSSVKRKRYQAQLYSNNKMPVTLSSKGKENLHCFVSYSVFWEGVDEFF